MKTLLHVCCGPCASACVPRLKDEGDEVTMFFANSNLDTKEEFDKRLAEARKLAAADGVDLVADEYDHERWLKEVAAGHEDDPEKGKRCERCFRFNLARAAEYAAANGFDGFTSSLTVSPHKPSRVVFAAGADVAEAKGSVFFERDFKKREGFKLSVARAKELGLYRQAYCGCEFSRRGNWKIHHLPETSSTNIDAESGKSGDVFTTDYQTAGRGRLDHRWLSRPGENLAMSAVIDVANLEPELVATLPLVVGLASVEALAPLVASEKRIGLKWPNDVLVGGRKLAGILCERRGDRVIAGIGVNVRQRVFAEEISARATSLSLEGADASVEDVRDNILKRLTHELSIWRRGGFAAVRERLMGYDLLAGMSVEVVQNDAGEGAVRGVCGGINPDGSLDVGGVAVYAGEAHVKGFCTI